MSKADVSGGWVGKILKVDLSHNRITEELLGDELAFSFLGGRGFDAKFLWDLVKPGTDPLGPGNILSLGAGLLSGTVFPECGRINVGCLSPLTGIYGCGNSGGWWPGRLKAAGYDHIVISGKSPNPVYMLINDGGVEISYFAVLGSDGEVRIAFDACDVCGGYKGYKQVGRDIKCKNCGRVFSIDGLGTQNKGYGCWPSYLPHEIKGNDVLIKTEDILNGKKRFV